MARSGTPGRAGRGARACGYACSMCNGDGRGMGGAATVLVHPRTRGDAPREQPAETAGACSSAPPPRGRCHWQQCHWAAAARARHLARRRGRRAKCAPAAPSARRARPHLRARLPVWGCAGSTPQRRASWGGKKREKKWGVHGRALAAEPSLPPGACVAGAGGLGRPAHSPQAGVQKHAPPQVRVMTPAHRHLRAAPRAPGQVTTTS